MLEKIRKIRSNMAIYITSSVVSLLVLFGIIVCISGILSFTNAFDEMNSTTTFHMAYTAASLVNGDHIKAYLAGEEPEEYARTKRILDAYCHMMSFSLIYVIDVDQSDYERFVSVFNAVDNTVDDSNYVPWEIGHKRETTDEEYRKNYEALYAKEKEYATIYRLRPGQGLKPHITTIVPVTNSEGDVTALLCIQRPIHELETAIIRFMLHIVVIVLIMGALASHLAARSLAKWVFIPIKRVSDEASRFARENTKGEELGDVSRFEEIDTLSRSIDKMETDMVNYIENLTAYTAERERIGMELSFAKNIQHSSLPAKFPAFPDRTDFDIYAYMKPAREVGGDFYNFRLLDDDHLAMWIGDVSDKGVPAALFMMAINIVINNRASMGGTPAEIMAFVNNNICEHNEANLFVTIWLGILEISTGRLTFVNAGHEEPALYRKGGSFELYKTKHNVAVGVFPDIEYTSYDIHLGRGDKLFVYTDGVPEATDMFDKLFTTGRMLEALNRYRDGAPQEILEGVRKSVKEFVGGRPQFDDLTMLGFELK